MLSSELQVVFALLITLLCNDISEFVAIVKNLPMGHALMLLQKLAESQIHISSAKYRSIKVGLFGPTQNMWFGPDYKQTFEGLRREYETSIRHHFIGMIDTKSICREQLDTFLTAQKFQPIWLFRFLSEQYCRDFRELVVANNSMYKFVLPKKVLEKVGDKTFKNWYELVEFKQRWFGKFKQQALILKEIMSYVFPSLMGQGKDVHGTILEFLGKDTIKIMGQLAFETMCRTVTTKTTVQFSEQVTNHLLKNHFHGFCQLEKLKLFATLPEVVQKSATAETLKHCLCIGKNAAKALHSGKVTLRELIDREEEKRRVVDPTSWPSKSDDTVWYEALKYLATQKNRVMEPIQIWKKKYPRSAPKFWHQFHADYLIKTGNAYRRDGRETPAMFTVRQYLEGTGQGKNKGVGSFTPAMGDSERRAADEAHDKRKEENRKMFVPDEPETMQEMRERQLKKVAEQKKEKLREKREAVKKALKEKKKRCKTKTKTKSKTKTKTKSGKK
jgi:hypothetical protein